MKPTLRPSVRPTLIPVSETGMFLGTLSSQLSGGPLLRSAALGLCWLHPLHVGEGGGLVFDLVDSK